MPPPAASASAPLTRPVARPGLRALGSDEALARRAGAGDHDAFAVLYGRYAARLEAYCRSIVRHDEDARDALQTTMTNAWLALRRQDREIVVRPWLYRIAHNEAVTVLRRRRPAAELSELVPDGGLDPHARALVREDLGAVVDGIRALPDRLAHPLLLRELSGLSYDEVGAVLGTPPGDARKAVFEARSTLTADRAAVAEDCSAIRETLSSGDGRRRRARRVRSHLWACSPCREWDHMQRDRRERLAALPFGAVPAGGLWAWAVGLVGAGSSGGGAALLSGAIGANMKAAASVAVIALGTAPAVPAAPDAEEHHARRPSTTTAPAPAVTTASPAPRVLARNVTTTRVAPVRVTRPAPTAPAGRVVTARAERAPSGVRPIQASHPAARPQPAPAAPTVRPATTPPAPAAAERPAGSSPAQGPRPAGGPAGA